MLSIHIKRYSVSPCLRLCEANFVSLLSESIIIKTRLISIVSKPILIVVVVVVIDVVVVKKKLDLPLKFVKN